MRTGEEVNIRVVEWQSTVRRHASFCSQARRHRPLSSQRPPPDLVSLWVIPLYTLSSPGHPGYRPPTLRTRRIFPLPQPLSLLIPLQYLFFRLSFLIMTSLALSSSSVSSLHSASLLSFHTASSPPSPRPLATSSASSSQVSFGQADEG